MNSLGYLNGLTSGLLILIAVGATYKSIEICLSALLNGESLEDAIKKIKKKIAVVIICSSLATMVALFKRYYM